MVHVKVELGALKHGERDPSQFGVKQLWLPVCSWNPLLVWKKVVVAVIRKKIYQLRVRVFVTSFLWFLPLSTACSSLFSQQQWVSEISPINPKQTATERSGVGEREGQVSALSLAGELVPSQLCHCKSWNTWSLCEHTSPHVSFGAFPLWIAFVLNFLRTKGGLFSLFKNYVL